MPASRRDDALQVLSMLIYLIKLSVMTFKDKLFSEYPIPFELSIWGGDNIKTLPVGDINVLIESAVDEIASDILITAYIEATGMTTQMPEGTVTVSSAMLSGNFPFQGNRLIKATYDIANRVCYLRYYPAVITYKRKLQVSDLLNLSGDQLIFTKSYILWKMAEKELAILKAADMTVDNGTINLSVLESFRDKMYDRYKDLKEGILLYSTVF